MKADLHYIQHGNIQLIIRFLIVGRTKNGPLYPLDNKVVIQKIALCNLLQLYESRVLNKLHKLDGLI